MYRKNTAGQFVGFQLLLTSTGAIATGLSPAVRRCIDGAFAAATGTVTEDTGTGGYKFAMSQADTNGNDISFWFTATGAMPVCVNIVTTAADPTDSVRLGLTALPNAAASAVGGLPLSVDTSGRVDVLKINGTSQTARDIGASVITASGTVTTVTNQLTAAAIATGVWTDTTAGDFTTALSVGKSVMNGVSLGTGLTVNAVTGLTASNLDAAVSSRMATYTQPTGFLAATFPTGTVANTTNITSITGNITGNLSGSVGSVTGAVGSVTGAVGSVTGNVGGNVVGSVASVTARVTANTDQVNGNATAASNVSKSMQAIVRGTCSGGTTTTAVVSSMTSPATMTASGQLIGRTILFDSDTSTAALQGQASNITANTTGSTPTITFTAMTTAPANGDTFSVV